MQLFCSTRNEELPLFSAGAFMRSSGFVIWSVRLPARHFLDEVRPLLMERVLVSACILKELPPEDKEWVFYEWHGRLLIDFDLAEEILRDDYGWRWTSNFEELNVAIFEPTNLLQEVDSPQDADLPPNFAGRATLYRELLESEKRGEVPLRREWIISREAQAALFGKYADASVGGAIALLSLSGAASADEFTLRSPAALDLDVDASDYSLVSKSVRDSLVVRCMGGSTLDDFGGVEGFKTGPDRWSELLEQARTVAPSSFFMALELDATFDPTIQIPRGAVFEQMTLIGVQTLAVAAETNTIVSVDEVKPLMLPAYCLNSDLSPPSGQIMRPTPFIYRRAVGTQNDVWRARRLR